MTLEFPCRCPDPAPFEATPGYPLCAKCGGTCAPRVCICKAPQPKHLEEGNYICARCRAPLKCDTHGHIYRSKPGDLDSSAMIIQRATKGHADVISKDTRELVADLTEPEKRKLAAMPRRKFWRVAKEMIARRARIKAALEEAGGEPQLSPNARRRQQRNLAKVVDMVILARDSTQ